MWTCTGIRSLVYVVVQAQRQGAERAAARPTGLGSFIHPEQTRCCSLEAWMGTD